MGILSTNSQQLFGGLELRHPVQEQDTKGPQSKREGLHIVTYFLKMIPPPGMWRQRSFHTMLMHIQIGTTILASNLAEFGQIKYTHNQGSNNIVPGYPSDTLTQVCEKTYAIMLTATLFVGVCPSLESKWVTCCGGKGLAPQAAVRNNDIHRAIWNPATHSHTHVWWNSQKTE